MLAAAALGVAALSVPAARAQTPSAFGIEERFAAAKLLVILGVQQAISDLPPTSGQSFVLEYDPKLDLAVSSGRPGPSAFLAPETIGEHEIDVRAATSFFRLAKSFRPIDYEVTDTADPNDVTYTKAGLDVSANVWVASFGVTYGLAKNLDLALGIPVVVVDASASASITTCQEAAAAENCDTEPNPPIAAATVVGVRNRARIDAPGFLRGEDPVIRQRSGSAREFDTPQQPVPFDEGTHVGVGRITLAVKRSFALHERFVGALFGQLALPSPSADGFAGSDSVGLMARAVGAADVTRWARAYADVGYEYDTEFDELQRFLWNAGASFSVPAATVDLGFGGSVYTDAIHWTPTRTSVFSGEQMRASTLVAIEDNAVSTSYASFRTGARLRLSDRATLSGVVSVPVTSGGFQPDVVATLALDVDFDL
jgi:hypothetical protein